jgi:hypothetical protein
MMAPMAAVTAAAVMTSSAAAMPTVTAATAMAAVTAVTDQLYARAGSDVFLVKDIEGRQADVRDFLLTKCEIISLVARNVGSWPRGNCGRAACEGQ